MVAWLPKQHLLRSILDLRCLADNHIPFHMQFVSVLVFSRAQQPSINMLILGCFIYSFTIYFHVSFSYSIFLTVLDRLELALSACLILSAEECGIFLFIELSFENEGLVTSFSFVRTQVFLFVQIYFSSMS